MTPRNAGRLSLLVVLALCSRHVFAEPSARIYLALDDHTDYFWTASDSSYRAAFINMIDHYLNRADDDIANSVPGPFQTRFNVDGTLWVYEYRNNKPAADFQRLIERIRSGHIGVPANVLVSSPGVIPAEGYTRGLYFAGRLAREYELPIDIAIAMENQTLPLGLATLWRAAGVTSSWKGVCGCATNVSDILAPRDHEVYRYVGLDGSAILMKWYSLPEQPLPGAVDRNEGPGGYAEARFPSAAINYVTSNTAFLTRHSPDAQPANAYHVVGLFGKGWDDFVTLQQPTDPDDFPAVAQQNSINGRQVIVSNQRDYFADFAATHQILLPAQTASFGNEWEISSANYQEQTSRMKRSIEQLRTGEALAAIISQVDTAFYNAGTRPQQRERAFLNMHLFYEHNMGMQSPPTGSAGVTARRSFQRDVADQVSAYTNSLVSDGLQRLGQLIPNPLPAAERIFVFNPLGFVRDELADVAYSGPANIEVVDVASNQVVAHELLDLGADGRFLRVFALGVPAVGYRVYQLRTTPAVPTPQTFASFDPATRTVQTPRFTVRFGTNGAITSISDSTDGGRELVAAGGSLNELTGGAASLSVYFSGPLSFTLRAQRSTGSAADPARDTYYTFYRDENRIDLDNFIVQNFGQNVVTWKFALNYTNTLIRHEELGAILDARLISQGGHYADRQARYDWLTANHFVDVSDDAQAAGLTISNWDLSLVRRGASTPSLLDSAASDVAFLAGGRVIAGDANFNQAGDGFFVQRFSLKPHASYSAADAMRFALRHQNPLVVGNVSGPADAPMNTETSSVLGVETPGVFLWAVKPGEDDPSTLIARVWNVAPQPQTVTVQATGVWAARLASSVETPAGQVVAVGTPATGTSLTDALPAHGWQTYALEPVSDNAAPVLQAVASRKDHG